MRTILLGLGLLLLVLSLRSPAFLSGAMFLLVVFIFAYGIRGTSAPLEEIEHQYHSDPEVVRKAGGCLAWLLSLVIAFILFSLLARVGGIRRLEYAKPT